MHLDNYQSTIAASRYCRFLWDENRREVWPEPVDRYLSFLQQHLKDNYKYNMPQELLEELRSAIVNLEVLPSMRALMTAGRALELDNTCSYNCSYVPVDSPRAFDETLYILMNGTGVGFSVETDNVRKLPEIAEEFEDVETTIVVEDSKEGWAKGLKQLISLLYVGHVPAWDLSRLRPPGAPLKTFGGRSSGPGPLDELFRFCVDIFRGAAGRRLTSIECHDIMCKIGEVVVVGGVRRSALISLSDLNDDRMRRAKHGQWWEHDGQRALANNSWVATNGRPDPSIFLNEWTALYESKSGERGIFSRSAARRQVAKNGRRDVEHQWGTNPCSEIILRPYQFCNLTEVVCREEDTLDDLQRKIRLATILGTFQSTLTNFKYLRKIWQKNTEEERLLGVSLTGIFDCPTLLDCSGEDLQALRNGAVGVNKELAEQLGINQSTAITCVKPSGTVSQLVNSASGIHPRFAQHYIRRIRADNKDPVTEFLKDIGIPAEADVMAPDNVTVLSFPIKAGSNVVTKDEVSALEHLEFWKKFAENWCEHKPSITVYVKEDEWLDVGAWVYRNFDLVSGISFLPFDGGTYRQAPYEEISESAYEALAMQMPETINWQDLSKYESREHMGVTGAQEAACAAGVCEITDIGKVS